MKLKERFKSSELIIEKRRIQRNDPEVQLRHKEVSDRLKNNYSTSSLKSTSNLMPSSDNDNQSSINPTSSNSNTTANFSLSSIKNMIPSSLPSFLTLKNETKKGKIYFFLIRNTRVLICK